MWHGCKTNMQYLQPLHILVAKVVQKVFGSPLLFYVQLELQERFHGHSVAV